VNNDLAIDREEAVAAIWQRTHTGQGTAMLYIMCDIAGRK
jgi:hypothetical protein